jgi:nucleoside-diphosphate-sugar epimerase
MSHRVFVTGATGYLGNAIAERLVRAGHEVLGLTRSRESAATLEATGIRPVLGNLNVSESYLPALKNCDAVVHAAIDSRSAAQTDQRALEAIRAAAEDGRVRRLLFTSGVWVMGPTGEIVADESLPLEPAEVVKWRPAHEEVALDLEHVEVATVVLRPGMVYGGTRGTFGDWFQEARRSHTITYPGDGSQHWIMVHLDDVAEAYMLALEHSAGGERYLLADPSQHTVRDLAVAAARVVSAETRSSTEAQVRETYGDDGPAMLMDQRGTAAKARRELGWVPRHLSFVAEADALHREWLTGQKAPVT